MAFKENEFSIWKYSPALQKIGNNGSEFHLPDLSGMREQPNISSTHQERGKKGIFPNNSLNSGVFVAVKILELGGGVSQILGITLNSGNGKRNSWNCSQLLGMKEIPAPIPTEDPQVLGPSRRESPGGAGAGKGLENSGGSWERAGKLLGGDGKGWKSLEGFGKG